MTSSTKQLCGIYVCSTLAGCVRRVMVRYVNVVIDCIMFSQFITPYALIVTVKQIVTAAVNEDNCETSHRYHTDFFALLDPPLPACKSTLNISFKRLSAV